MHHPRRRAVTLIECLVTLVASSVLLGGFLGLFTVADQAARGNVSDIYAAAADHNLDRVLSDIASMTSSGGAPTRQAFGKTGAFPDVVGPPKSRNMVLVYERPRDIRSTAYWNFAQGGPAAGVNDPPSAVPGFNENPYALFLNPHQVTPAGVFGSPARMTNIDMNQSALYRNNWVTGIVALNRSDFDGTKYRKGILWHVEIPMDQTTSVYSLPFETFCPNVSPGTNGFATCYSAASINVLLNSVANPHLLLPGTRVLAVGVQTFEVDAGDPMTWAVTR